MQYRADIDGLRAIAVLLVILYHAGVPGLSGGFVGVDVFFVISGFLITSIILSSLNKGIFSFKSFYARRARRLLPALFLVLIVSAVCAYWLLSPKHIIDFGKSLAATILFSSNLYFISESDYFAAAIELKPLIHTWSLAVEEQYYLLFPLLMMWLYRSKKLMINGLVALFLASFVFAVWAFGNVPRQAFYFLFTRAWELLAGSLIAMMLINHRESWERLIQGQVSTRILNAASWLGLGAVFYSANAIDKHTTFLGSGVGLWVPVVGTVLVLVGSQPGSLVYRLLALKPFVFIGLISYSLYLWHQPILAFSRHYQGASLDVLDTVIVLIASFVLAYFSWRFVEKPIRYRHRLSSAKKFLFTILTLSCAGIVFGVLAYQSQGFESRYQQQHIIEYKQNSAKYYSWSGCRDSSCGSKVDKPTVLLIGDSHAAAISTFLNNELTDQYNFQWSAAAACPPLIGYVKSSQDGSDCSGRNTSLLKRVSDDPSIEWVVLVGHWGTYASGRLFNNGAGGVENGANIYYMSDELLTRQSKQRSDVIARGYAETVEAFLATGKKVLLVGQIPVAGWDVPEAMLTLRDNNLSPEKHLKYDRAKYRSFARYTLPMMQLEHDNLVKLQADELFCEQNICFVVRDEQPLYVDTNHLSPQGATKLAMAINKRILEYKK